MHQIILSGHTHKADAHERAVCVLKSHGEQIRMWICHVPAAASAAVCHEAVGEQLDVAPSVCLETADLLDAATLLLKGATRGEKRSASDAAMASRAEADAELEVVHLNLELAQDRVANLVRQLEDALGEAALNHAEPIADPESGSEAESDLPDQGSTGPIDDQAGLTGSDLRLEQPDRGERDDARLDPWQTTDQDPRPV